MTKAVWAGSGRAKTKVPVAGLFSSSFSACFSLGGFGSLHCIKPMSPKLAAVNYRGAHSLAVL